MSRRCCGALWLVIRQQETPIMSAAMAPLLAVEMEWRKADAYKMEDYREELEAYEEAKRKRRSPKCCLTGADQRIIIPSSYFGDRRLRLASSYASNSSL